MAQSKRAKVANYLCRLNFRSPLGSANAIKHLIQVNRLVSNNCPINVYGQAWTACRLDNICGPCGLTAQILAPPCGWRRRNDLDRVVKTAPFMWNRRMCWTWLRTRRRARGVLWTTDRACRRICAGHEPISDARPRRNSDAGTYLPLFL